MLYEAKRKAFSVVEHYYDLKLKMNYVYILKSIEKPNKHYVGLTSNLENRLKAHNDGKTVFGNKYRPWKIETYIKFNDRKKAAKFERYLKKGSGHSFLKRHLV